MVSSEYVHKARFARLESDMGRILLNTSQGIDGPVCILVFHRVACRNILDVIYHTSDTFFDKRGRS